MVIPFVGSAAPIAAFAAITRRRAGWAGTAERKRERPKRSGGRRAATILFRDAKPVDRGHIPRALSGGGTVVDPDRLPSDRPLEGHGRPLRRRARARSTDVESTRAHRLIRSPRPPLPRS